MTQLLCNNTPLDLYDSAGLQFTDENMLFAFDNIKCERTAQFKLPRTQTNDKLLALARVPAYNGAGMRRKFEAVLMDGQIVKRGYLYVSAFDGTDYEAIFVTGDLLGLQRIKDAGKMRDFYGATDHAVWTNPIDASAAIQVPWGAVKYKQANKENPVTYPSMQVKGIIEGAAAQLGVPVTLPAGIENLRIIPANLKPYEKKVVFSSRQKAPSGVGDRLNNVADFLAVFDPVLIPVHDVMGTVVYYDDHEGNHGYCYNYSLSNDTYYLQGWRARTKVFLYADGDFNSRFFQFRKQDVYNSPELDSPFHSAHYVSNYDGITIDELGHIQSTVVYPPIKLVCEPGDVFTFLNKYDITILNSDPTEDQEGQTFKVAELSHLGVPYATGGQPDYNLYVNLIAGAKDVKVGFEPSPYEFWDDVYMYAFLPDCTFVQLLQAVAYLTGTTLNYTDADGVTFDALNFDTWNKVEIGRILKRGEIKRTFADYAQKNTVGFNSDETLSVLDKISRTYNIDNDNITASKELAKIFASEGSRAFISVQGGKIEVLYMNNEEKEISKYTICQAEANMEYLTRVNLPENSGITRLCDKSTQIKIDARMYALAYNSIKPNTLLLVDGSLYVWTAKNWQKDIASLTLAKI